MPIRPIAVPRFATDPASIADVTEPVELVRQAGFLPDDRPPAPWINWQFRQIGDWIDYLRGPGSSNWTRRSFAIGTSVDAVAVDETTTDEGSPTPDPIRRMLTVQTVSGTARLYASSRGQAWRDIAHGLAIETSIPTAVLFTGDRWIVGTTTNGKIYWSYPSGGLLGASAIDGAAAWVAATIPAGGEPITALATDGASIVVAMSATKIRYSTDKGATFADATFSDVPSNLFTSVCFDGVAWVAIDGDGEIFRTTLVSGAWTLEGVTLPPGNWRLRVGQSHIVAFDYLGSGYDIYLSEDNGVSFTAQTLDSAHNTSFSQIREMRFLSDQWWMLQSGIPSLSANNDITDALGWTGQPVPFYSDAPGYDWIVLSDGALSLFGGTSMLTGTRAVSTAPGPWSPLGAPAQLHDAAYLRGSLVSGTAPTEGQTLVWNATADEYEPGYGSGGLGPSAIDYVTGDVTNPTGPAIQLLRVDAGAPLAVSITAPAGGGFLLIDFQVSMSNQTKSNNLFELRLDGTLIPNADRATKVPQNADSDSYTLGITTRVAVAAGNHSVTVFWTAAAGTGRIFRASNPGADGASLRAVFVRS